jgi:hypothetical protein
LSLDLSRHFSILLLSLLHLIWPWLS